MPTPHLLRLAWQHTDRTVTGRLIMEARGRLELPTCWLEANRCYPVELPPLKNRLVAGVGFEPTTFRV